LRAPTVLPFIIISGVTFPGSANVTHPDVETAQVFVDLVDFELHPDYDYES